MSLNIETLRMVVDWTYGARAVIPYRVNCAVIAKHTSEMCARDLLVRAVRMWDTAQSWPEPSDTRMADLDVGEVRVIRLPGRTPDSPHGCLDREAEVARLRRTIQRFRRTILAQHAEITSLKNAIALAGGDWS